MMSSRSDSGDITRLLQLHFRGDREAFDALVPLVYERMRPIARGQLARVGRGQTLDTRALVHETYLQLVDETGVDWQNRSHFYAICARAMRRIAVDHARRRTAEKRGGGAPLLTLDPEALGVESRAETVLAVDRALSRLWEFNEQLARLVECRYFGGLSEEETAEALQVSVRTVQRHAMRARAWLRSELA